MSTTYFTEIAIPNEDEPVVVGPFDSIRAISHAYGAAWIRLKEADLPGGDDPPPFRVYAEEDGVQRPLSQIEDEALMEKLEFLFGRNFRLYPPG
jgi:hypothetical protein